MSPNQRPYQAIPPSPDYIDLETPPQQDTLTHSHYHTTTHKAIQYEHTGQSSYNIVSYNTTTLVTYGWIFPYRGSIFHPKIFLYITIQFVLSTILANFKCISDDNPSPQYGPFCVPLPDSMTALTLLTVTSFLVGLFTNNLMQRWWQIRTALNNVRSKSTNLVNAFTASVAVNTQHCSPDIRAEAICLTQNVKRYLQLAHALVYIRGNPNQEYSEHILQARKLLTVHEASLLEPLANNTFNNKLSTHVYGWVLLCLEKASTAGVLGPVRGFAPTQHVVTFFNELSLIQSAAADVDMYISTQLPYPFIQMTALLVYMFLFQLFFVTTGIIGDGFLKHNSALYMTGYCTQILMTFVMLGVLHLYVVLCNPIGPDGADFPTSTFMLEYEDQTNRLVESLWKASCLPEQIEVTANTLARSPEQQLEVFGRKPELKGCLPVMQSFSITHDNMSAL